MTLEVLKDSWEAIATGHTGITTFHYGESFDSNKFKDSTDYYPLFYLELPYSILYGDYKQISFAVVVLFLNVFDDPNETHKRISQAETIADSILQQYDATYRKGFRIDSSDGVSLDRYTDDQTCGVRISITGRAKRHCTTLDEFSS